MATMPSRASSLSASLATVARQVDTLFLYLDKHDAVPAVATAYSNVVPLLPRDVGEWAAAGKFLALGRVAGPFFFLGFDDDILYPPDYSGRLVHALVRRGGRAVVGIHGGIFRPPYRSYLKDRWETHFKRRLWISRQVDLVGTGTAAFHTDFFRFDIATWTHRRMLDLELAMEASRQGLPVVALRRPRRWLMPIAEAQKDSIYRGIRRDETEATTRMRTWLRHRLGPES